MIKKQKIYLMLFLLISLLSCTKSTNDEENDEKVNKVQELYVDEAGLSTSYAEIITKYGSIKFKFYPRKAPRTITRFIELCQNNFYDGLVFHRVEPGYLIQTGDPTNTGKGGSGKKLKAEFNDIQHVKGTVGMVRYQNDTNSADSQFYITLNTYSHLDQKFTVFGQVYEGLDKLNKIKKDDKILSLKFYNIDKKRM